MSGQTWTVFAILSLTVALFAIDRLRLDLVALLSLLALLLTGVLTIGEGLAGFSDPLVLTIAGLFVVGGGLFRTGVADRIGSLLSRIGGQQPARLVAVIMTCVAGLSAFLSSTGTVAILLPVVVRMADRAKISPSKLLMPLSLASLLGGLLTLIGTPPNLVVSQQLADRGLPSFSFFSFTPVGLVLVGVGVAFMTWVGWRMLPDRSTHGQAERSEPELQEVAAAYDLPGNLWWLQVGVASTLTGKTLLETQLRSRYGVTVLEFQGGKGDDRPHTMVSSEQRFDSGDRLLVHGAPEQVRALCTDMGLSLLPPADAQELVVPGHTAVAEVLLTPRSQLIGRTLREVRFHDVYDLTAVAVLRRGKPVKANLATIQLRFGDALLVQGAPHRISALGRSRRDLVIVGVPPAAEPTSIGLRGVVALLIMGTMLALMTLQLLPTVTAVLVAAAAMVLLRCLDMEEAYRSINWESIVLIASMLPMATALSKTGGIATVVDALTNTLGRLGPLPLMAGIFVMTALFSQFISNTATTVLVAPIAVEAAARLGVSARPLLMSVAIAASTSFATPVASPVNTLILTPGGYRFSDFLKVGLSLQVLLFGISIALVPLLFAFDAS